MLAVVLQSFTFAKPVDETTACAVASHFYTMKCKQIPGSLTTAIVYQAPMLRGENTSAHSFYVVNINSEGFVIVAGDDRVQPILACTYSFFLGRIHRLGSVCSR